MTSICHKFQIFAGTFIFCLILSGPSSADVTLPDYQIKIPPTFALTAGTGGHHFLAQNEEKAKNKYQPKSGTLLMPSDTGKKDDNKEGKKCMTVCNRWGQDCIIDPARGRQCRRTCKEFGEECF